SGEMGGTKSKIQAEQRINATLAASQERERKAHQDHLERLERQQAEAEAAKRRADEIYRNEMREKENLERAREDKLREELRLIQEKHEEDKMREEQLSLEERRKMTERFDATVKEKEEALRRQQHESRIEMEALRKKQEDRDNAHAKNLSKINDERLKQEERHGQQLAAMAEKATAITREMGEKMLENQQQAFKWLIAQEQAHLDSMSQVYVIMAAIPRAISSDKETQDLVGIASSIRCTVASIKEPFNKLDELCWRAGTPESYEQREENARAMFSLNESNSEHFIKLINSIEKSQSVDNSTRSNLMDSILDVKRKANDLSEELRQLLRTMVRTPASIGDAEIDAVRDLLKSLDTATDAIPKLQGISATERLEDSMRQLKANDHESWSKIDFRESMTAIKDGETAEALVPTSP
ncbi:hypothetical protein PENTCL1PPCAC_22304, partial [Pristionchus entomophagus]